MQQLALKEQQPGGAFDRSFVPQLERHDLTYTHDDDVDRLLYNKPIRMPFKIQYFRVNWYHKDHNSAVVLPRMWVRYLIKLYSAAVSLCRA